MIPPTLACARRYAGMFLARDELYLCVECHKFLWGLAELQQVAPRAEYKDAARKCAGYLVTAQQPDGSWLPEASSEGGEPSLELILNTLANALVGLAYYRIELGARSGPLKACRSAIG